MQLVRHKFISNYYHCIIVVQNGARSECPTVRSKPEANLHGVHGSPILGRVLQHSQAK